MPRYRKLLVLVLEFSLLLPILMPYFYFLSINGSVNVPEKIALAAYSGQIQTLALFASLSPVLFMVTENISKPKKKMLKYAVFYALLLVGSSSTAIGLSLLLMLSQAFTVGAVLIPLFFIVVDAYVLGFYMVAAAGLLQRLMTWAQWSFY